MARDLVTAEAFVLRTVDYADAHVIVTLLARDIGKFGAIARSARRSRKRFGGALLPLRGVRVTAEFKPNRDLAELDSATVSHDFPGLEESYEKIAVASYATELVRSYLRDGDEANDVFELLGDFYGRLAESEADLAVLRFVLHHFELELLRIAGAAPSLDRCHRCGARIETFDRLRCGRDGHGLVCEDCVQPGMRYGILAPQTMEVLAYLQSPHGRPPEAIADHDVGAQVRRLLDASLELVLDATLKSRAMLDSVMNPAPLPEVSR